MKHLLPILLLLLLGCDKFSVLEYARELKKQKGRQIPEASVQVEVMTLKGNSLNIDDMELADKVRFDIGKNYNSGFLPKEDSIDPGQAKNDLYILHNQIIRVDALPWVTDTIPLIVNNAGEPIYWLRMSSVNVQNRAFVRDTKFNPEGTDLEFIEDIPLHDNQYTYWLWKPKAGNYVVDRFKFIVK